jgi:hypothetical protein
MYGRAIPSQGRRIDFSSVTSAVVNDFQLSTLPGLTLSLCPRVAAAALLSAGPTTLEYESGLPSAQRLSCSVRALNSMALPDLLMNLVITSNNFVPKRMLLIANDELTVYDHVPNRGPIEREHGNGQQVISGVPGYRWIVKIDGKAISE